MELTHTMMTKIGESCSCGLYSTLVIFTRRCDDAINNSKEHLMANKSKQKTKTASD